MTPTRLVVGLSVVLVAGLTVGTVAGTGFLGTGMGVDSVGVDAANPPMSASTAGGCASPHQRNASGWLVETNARDGHVLVFNQTYAGDGGAEVHLQSLPASDAYTLVITTNEKHSSQKRGTPPAECSPTTSVQASATIPLDYASFSVVRDGETVIQLNNTHETTTRVWSVEASNTTR